MQPDTVMTLRITDLLGLHDAMMEIATVRMIEQAHAWAVASIQVLQETP